MESPLGLGKLLTPTQFYKSLSDDIRLKSLIIIEKEGESCVCELMVALNETSQPKVSRHLAKLKQSGLVVDRKQQQWVFYSINPDLPKWMHEIIKSTAIESADFIEAELSRLNNMGDRPSRKLNCC